MVSAIRITLKPLLYLGVLLSVVGIAHAHSIQIPQAPLAIIHKSGTIAADEIWTPDNLYVIDGNLTITNGVTLTIQAGVIVKLWGLDTGAQDGSLFVNGRLIARGTSTNKVYFTSLRDDSVGGDTNGDGSTTTPAAGDWNRIELSSSSTNSIIENAVIRYAGYDRWYDYYGWHSYAYASIRLLGASPTISSTTLSNNYSDAILCDLSSAPLIVNSTLSSNGGYGVYADHGSTPTISGTTFSHNTRWAFSTTPSVFPVLSGNTLSGNGGNGLELREGNVDVNTTWSLTEHPYGVTGNIVVGNDVTLTVAPGVIVKLWGLDTGAQDGSLFVNGRLIARGTSTNKVYFTSLRDDSVGGDTNGDGSATTPAAGDWNRIELSSSSTNSIIENAVIRYAGYDRWYDYYGWHSYAYASIRLLGASPTISSTTISNNYSDAILCDLSSSPLIASNTLSSNGGYGVYCESGSTPTVTGNTISNHGKWAFSTTPMVFPTLQGNSLTKNAGNGLEIRGGNVDMDTTWVHIEHPYGITGDIHVGYEVTLTVEPGTILKFWNDNLYVDGTLKAQGTNSQRIYFTSLRDDSAGGDTNGDGSASTPGTGNWGKIEFSGSSISSVIEYAVIRYASTGVSALGASPLISRTMLIANTYGVWAKSLANPVIHYCKIEQNTQYGVKNDDSNVLVNAEYNWWGDPQGPSTETHNTPKGDKVSNYVDYTPWLTQSPFAPVVLSLNTSQVKNDTDHTIVVTGTGFLPTPGVKLGSTLMGGVTWMTMTQISFMIPISFPVGIYNLTIINPDSESTIVPNAITVHGSEVYIYLPIVLRK